MSKLPTSRTALMASGATCIASANSLPVEAYERLTTQFYTELSVWWLDDDRPFIGVVEGLPGPAADDVAQPKFRAETYGTLQAALDGFDPSNLRDDLIDAIPDDAKDIYPDANALRSRRSARARRERLYDGALNLRDVALWLYDDADDTPSTAALARWLEEDFGVPWRTATRALNGEQSNSWGEAFLKAMPFFDRSQWRAKMREKVDG